jgi:tungstate transport system substrate-binding protein
MVRFIRLIALSIALFQIVAAQAQATPRLKLATTTSTENSGLLQVLLPPFEKAYECQVDVIAVGTGKALKLAEAGDVDVVMVHARKKEEAFVSAGYGVERRELMYNDFVLLGPVDDPAGIKGNKDASRALQKLASAQALFVSRGDQSGTHTKELELWQAVEVLPAGAWYLETGRGMGEVITMANERQGYTLADRGTYIAYRDKIDLQIMVEGDKRLFNPYGVMAVNQKRHPHVKHELALAFIDYLTSRTGQKIIAEYRKNGETLFFIYDR